jgi:putative phosphonate metabolism protein
MHRYAIYIVPPEHTPLMQFANGWLGRDPYTGRAVPQPVVPGLAPERLITLTADPRVYGFHGTLKAPFELAPGLEPADLHRAVADLAEGHRPFSIDLVLASINGFLALVPREPMADLDDLAATCVEALDPLRAPLREADIARRDPSRLTPEQHDYLRRFGYPYIFEYFQFHMTLTGRLAGEDHDFLQAILVDKTAPLCREPFDIDALAVFEQPSREAPFTITGRYPFHGPGLT